MNFSKALALFALTTVSVAAQAGDYLVAECPVTATKTATIVLHTDASKAHARAISVRGIELQNTKHSITRRPSTVVMASEAADRYSFLFDESADQDAIGIELVKGMDMQAENAPKALGDLAVDVIYSGQTAPETLFGCRLVNEALIKSLAQK